MKKDSTTIWSNPFIAWVVVFLAVFVIIWLFSSAWFQFTLQAALILLLLYIVIGVPFTWLFFGLRAIYRKSVGRNHKNEVPVTVFILLAIAAAVISMIVSLWYSNDVEKYRDPCANGPPSWMSEKGDSYEMSFENRSKQYLIALEQLNKNRLTNELDLSEIRLQAYREDDQDMREQLFAQIDDTKLELEADYIEALKTKLGDADLRVQKECEEGFPYAYASEEPSLSFSEWGRLALGMKIEQ